MTVAEEVANRECRTGLAGVRVAVDGQDVMTVTSSYWKMKGTLIVRLDDGNEYPPERLVLAGHWPVYCCQPRVWHEFSRTPAPTRTVKKMSPFLEQDCCCHRYAKNLLRSEHRKAHARWMDGLQVPRSYWPELVTGFVVIDPSSPLRHIQFAHRLSEALRDECGHDGCVCPRYRSSFKSEKGLTILAVVERRAVGFVATLPSRRSVFFALDTLQDTGHSRVHRCAIYGIWVCRSLRRTGLGVGLVRAAVAARQARTSGIADDPCFIAPISDAGFRLARHFAVHHQVWIYSDGID